MRLFFLVDQADLRVLFMSFYCRAFFALVVFQKHRIGIAIGVPVHGRLLFFKEASACFASKFHHYLRIVKWSLVEFLLSAVA